MREQFLSCTSDKLEKIVCPGISASNGKQGIERNDTLLNLFPNGLNAAILVSAFSNQNLRVSGFVSTTVFIALTVASAKTAKKWPLNFILSKH